MIKAVNGVRYTVPSKIDADNANDNILIRFRVGDVYKDKAIVVRSGDIQILKRTKKIMAPGEMEQVIIAKDKLYDIGDELIIEIV